MVAIFKHKTSVGFKRGSVINYLAHPLDSIDRL